MAALMGKLRTMGVGVARSVEISLLTGVTVAVASSLCEKGTVLAVIPEAASLSPASLADSDHDGFFPPFEEFVECALDLVSRPGASTDIVKANIETLALAHFLALRHFLDSASWFSAQMATAPVPPCAPDEPLAILHKNLSSSFVTPPLEVLKLATAYCVRCAVTQRLPPPPAENTAATKDGTDTCTTHLIPFADVLIGAGRSFESEDRCNTTLQRLTAGEVRAHMQTPTSPHALHGARQQLAGKDDTTPYFAVVANQTIAQGGALTMYTPRVQFIA